MSKTRVPKVKVIHETESGLNDRISINGKIYTNNTAYKAVKSGKIKGLTAVKNQDGTKFVRSNPDGSKSNNIEK